MNRNVNHLKYIIKYEDDKKYNMNRITFGMAVLLGTVAMLSDGLVAAAIPTTMLLEASAQHTDFNFEQDQ